MFRAAAARVVSRLADLVWPRVCAVEGCARPCDRPGRHLCSACFGALPFQDPRAACAVCGLPVAVPVDHAFTCEACAKRPPSFAFARSPLAYQEPVGALLRAFKYNRATWLAEDFADLLEGMTRGWPERARIDALVPVPLHPARLRERGYNQSGLLAAALARRLNRRMLTARAFARVRDTEHQARLSGAERRTNLEGAFAVRRPEDVRGRTLLLLDDVTTTCSTLEVCARTLLEAGAARVWCATVARARLS